jgi:hypothetical protein
MSLSLRLFSRKQFLAVQIAPSQLVFQVMKLDHKQAWLKSENKTSARFILRGPMVRGDKYEAVLRHTSTVVAAPLPVAANA